MKCPDCNGEIETYKPLYLDYVIETCLDCEFEIAYLGEELLDVEA